MRLDANKFYAYGERDDRRPRLRTQETRARLSQRSAAWPATASHRESDNLGQLSLTVRLPQLPARPQSCNYEPFGRIS
jgi:hypothetical protein